MKFLPHLLIRLLRRSLLLQLLPQCSSGLPRLFNLLRLQPCCRLQIRLLPADLCQLLARLNRQFVIQLRIRPELLRILLRQLNLLLALLLNRIDLPSQLRSFIPRPRQLLIFLDHLLPKIIDLVLQRRVSGSSGEFPV